MTDYIEGELPTGTDVCKCSVCSLVFNSTYAFDKHRVLIPKTPKRRCLSVTEMSEAGMAVNAKGRWIGSQWDRGDM